MALSFSFSWKKSIVQKNYFLFHLYKCGIFKKGFKIDGDKNANFMDRDNYTNIFIREAN